MNYKLLIAVDNAYAAKDSLYNKLYLLDRSIKITILFVSGVGRDDSYKYLCELRSEGIIHKLVKVNRAEGIINTTHTIFRLLFRINWDFDYVLIGSSCNLEDKIVETFAKRKSVFISFLPTVPTVLARNEDYFTSKVTSSFDRFRIFLSRNKGNGYLRTCSLIFNRLINEFLLTLFGRPDKFSIRNLYVDKNLVSFHITTNNYWAKVLRDEYSGERVLSCIESIQCSEAVECTNNGHNLLLILGISDFVCDRIIELIHFFYEIVPIKIIGIRGHPRANNMEILANTLRKEFPNIKINLLPIGADPAAQALDYKYVIGYYSAVMNRLALIKNLYIFVDEQINKIELQCDTSVGVLTGSNFGFNSQIATIDNNNTCYCNITFANEEVNNFDKLCVSDLLNKIILKGNCNA